MNATIGRFLGLIIVTGFALAVVIMVTAGGRSRDAGKADDNPSEGPLVETDEYLTQGSLHGHVVVSVPASISHRAAHTLSEKLVKEFKRPVVIVTHNIHFMKLERLDREEAEAVTGRVTSRVVEEKLALEQLKALEAGRDPTQADSPEEEGVGNRDAPGSDGGGPGLRLVGGGDSGAVVARHDTDGEAGDGDPDREGEEEV